MAAKWIAASGRTEMREHEPTINILHFSILQENENEVREMKPGNIFTQKENYGETFENQWILMTIHDF